MNFIQKVILTVVVCALLGGGAYFYMGRTKNAENPFREAPTVETEAAVVGNIERRISAVGTLVATQKVVLRPQVSGRIAKILFDEGKEVTKDQPLYQLEDAEYKARYKDAQARLLLAKEQNRRSSELLKRGFGTPEQRDKTFAEMEIAASQVEQAKIVLDNSTIKAPFEGVMTINNVSVGTFVDTSTELATLIDLDPIYIDFSVPESFLGSMHTGDKVDVTVEGFDMLPMDATIKAINPQVDVATRTVVMRAEMPNAERALRPGEFARVQASAGAVKDAVLIPEGAIERRGEEEYVFVVSDGVAVETVIGTGMREGNKVEVTHGVKAGDLVVTAGQFKVRDGDEVKIANGEQAQENSESE